MQNQASPPDFYKPAFKWIDSHCHFDSPVFAQHRTEQWQLAQRFGVAALIIPGVSRQHGEKLPAFCAHQPWFYSQGLHPYFCNDHALSDLDWLEQQLREDPHILAVGEIGLDRPVAESQHNTALQQHLFMAQVELAQHYQKRLILHIRGKHDEACSYLRQIGFTHGGIVHAFSGSQQQAQAWLALGFKLGIGGAMTHTRAAKLRATVAALPASAWLLETDSPDMKSAFWGAATHSPAAIPLLAACLASIKKMPLAELARLQIQELLTLWPELPIDL